jgi:hypothetical protein
VQFSNVSGPIVVGQPVTLSVTNSNGQTVTWSSSLGSSFNPATSSVDSSGGATTTYTPAAAGNDNLTATDDTGATATSMIPVTAGGGGGGGGGGGYSISAGSAATIASTFAALVGIDFTSPSACGPVMAAQQAWNQAGGSPSLTVDGGYGPDTAQAWAAVAAMTGGGNVPAGLTGGFPNCGGGGGGGNNPPNPPPNPLPNPQPSGMPKWLKWGLIVLVLGGVAALGWWAFGTDQGRRTLGMASEGRKRLSSGRRRRRARRKRK